MLKLAYRYMSYYKSQTTAIFASILLTAALLSGVSSLMYSSQKNDLSNSKTIYGDWHYSVHVKPDIFESVQNSETGAGFSLTQCGKMEIREILKEPYPIYFIHADKTYDQMAHRGLLHGNYPKAEHEIAADRYTLGNLGFFGGVGDVLHLNGKDYLLTGIVKSAWAANSSEMQIFVGEDFAGHEHQTFLYLKFDEEKKLYRQLDAFLQKYNCSGDAVFANDEVVRYLSGERPDSIYEIVKFALTDENGNFTYIILKLQSEYHLAFYGMILLLCVFGLFIIYSIFRISVSKRTAEYGIMQTLGISEKNIMGMLMTELWMLFLFGYPTGCLLGNAVLKVCYQKFSNTFFANVLFADQTVREMFGTDQTVVPHHAENEMFFVAWDAMLIGFVFLFLTLAIVGVFTVRALKKQSLRQVINGDISCLKKRKIYSLRGYHLVNVLISKFMFSNRKKVIGILLSLSVGGCIFLCTTYMVENLKIHAEMSLKSDDGLGSEYRISLKSDILSDIIPKATIDSIREMPELSDVYATKYMFGELVIQKRELVWDEYFDERNKDGYFQNKYGGICTEKEDGTYGIKYNIYGYDAKLLTQLKEFVLEGEINPEDMERGNQIIAAANKDGQGNYDFYGKHPGDTITLRVPTDFNCAPEVLKFQSSPDHYVTKEFEIAAIVSRSLAQENNYLNVEPWKNSQSLILTNQQMSSQYGIQNYSFVNASAVSGTDQEQVSSQLLQKIQDVPKAVLQDYTGAIERQKQYLYRQQLFCSGIAVVLLVISLFHILNSMSYSILSRKREYGIVRAMGITDAGFYKMMLRTGILYGVLADVFIFLIYHLLFRKAMDYYMAHVMQFLHFSATVPGMIMASVMALNVLIAVLAVLIPAARIVKEDMIEALK